MANTYKKPQHQMFNGLYFPHGFSLKYLKEAFEYIPQPDDNFIITYPKSGTTWMQNMVISIYRKGQPLEDYKDFDSFSPFLDTKGLDGVRNMSKPGILKSHLPYNHMPYSPDAKYIFVARNPRDTCVSMYYHRLRRSRFEGFDGHFDDFFESFMVGEVQYGDYFDHLMSWYPHRSDKNIWYTTYEQMKADPKTVICKLAKFLGQGYADAIEKDNTVMNGILELTSFKFMKKNIKHGKRPEKLRKNSTTSEGVQCDDKDMIVDQPKELPKPEFFRKGIVGDWKNHFSQEQLRRLDAKFVEKTEGTDLGTWWTY